MSQRAGKHHLKFKYEVLITCPLLRGGLCPPERFTQVLIPTPVSVALAGNRVLN